MSFDYDPEVPAGFQDADIQQAEYEEQSRQAARLRDEGICTHSWTLGRNAEGRWHSRERIEEDRKRGHFPDLPTNFDPPPPGMVLCLNCGEHVPDPLYDELDVEEPGR